MKTKSKKIQEKLWSSDDLSLKLALDLAREIEQSEMCVQAVRHIPDAIPSVSVVDRNNKNYKNTSGNEKQTSQSNDVVKKKYLCFRCGSVTHLANSKVSPAVTKICSTCKKKRPFQQGV